MAVQAGRIVIDTKRLDEIAQKLNMRTEQVVSSIAFQVQGFAAELAPVDTGALRNSIHVEDGNNATTKIVADGVEYGIYQEYGPGGNGRTWRFKPFMVPACYKAEASLAKFYGELFA